MMDENEGGKISEIIGFIFAKVTQQDVGNISEFLKTKVRQDLIEAGFATHKIDKALSWLDDLFKQQLDSLLNKFQTSNYAYKCHGAMRCFSPEECIKLTKEVRGVIWRLERDGVLNTATREILINQLMRLDETPVLLNDFYWVAYVVAFSRPDKRPTQEEIRVLKELLVEIHG